MHSLDTPRRALDDRLAAWRELEPAGPARGWIRAIRESLGMTRDELAQRLGVTRQRVFAIEAAEADGALKLDTLRRAAEALDCTLVYALVPKESLQSAVERRAREVAERHVERAGHTMLLEGQLGAAGDRERLVEELTEQLARSRGLWRD